VYCFAFPWRLPNARLEVREHNRKHMLQLSSSLFDRKGVVHPLSCANCPSCHLSHRPCDYVSGKSKRFSRPCRTAQEGRFRSSGRRLRDAMDAVIRAPQTTLDCLCAGKLARTSRWKTGPGRRKAAAPVVSVGSRRQRRVRSVHNDLWGGLLSRERQKFAEAEPVSNVEGKDVRARYARADALPCRRPITQEGIGRNLGGPAFDRWATLPPRSASGR